MSPGVWAGGNVGSAGLPRLPAAIGPRESTAGTAVRHLRRAYVGKWDPGIDSGSLRQWRRARAAGALNPRYRDRGARDGERPAEDNYFNLSTAVFDAMTPPPSFGSPGLASGGAVWGARLVRDRDVAARAEALSPAASERSRTAQAHCSGNRAASQRRVPLRLARSPASSGGRAAAMGGSTSSSRTHEELYVRPPARARRPPPRRGCPPPLPPLRTLTRPPPGTPLPPPRRPARAAMWRACSRRARSWTCRR